jgi:hypothetical protein
MGRLNSGRVFAGVAWEVAGWCRGHMSMASVLVGSPIEDSLVLADREYNFAYAAVTRVLHLAEEAKAELIAVQQILAFCLGRHRPTPAFAACKWFEFVELRSCIRSSSDRKFM